MSNVETTMNVLRANGLRQYYLYGPQGNVENVIINATSATAVGFDAYGKRYGDPYANPFGYGGQWGYYTETGGGMRHRVHPLHAPIL